MLGAYAVKGLSMVVGLAAVPAYMRYFESNGALGTWYTIQTLLQWVLIFDLGIGNGLRNKLVPALVKGDEEKISCCISSAYRLLGVVCGVMMVMVGLMAALLPWNLIMNVPNEVLSARALSVCMVVVGCGVVIQLFLQLINGILYALQLSSIVNAIALVSNTLILAFVLLAPASGDDVNLCMLGLANVVCMALPLLAATIVVFKGNSLGCRVDFRGFKWRYAKESMSTGLVILFLQLTWVVVATTHPLLISILRGPSEVVEFQIYYKVYYTIGAIAAIALVPIWSAVTKAQAEGNYDWIIGMYRKYLLLLPLVVVAVCVASISFIQVGFDVWLGDRTILVNWSYVVVMTLFAVVFVLQNVNASIGNGLSFFTVQVVCMGLGAVAMIPLASFLCALTGSWIGVVLASIAAIMPFQVVEPIACVRYLQKLKSKSCSKGARKDTGRVI